MQGFEENSYQNIYFWLGSFMGLILSIRTFMDYLSNHFLDEERFQLLNEIYDYNTDEIVEDVIKLNILDQIRQFIYKIITLFKLNNKSIEESKNIKRTKLIFKANETLN